MNSIVLLSAILTSRELIARGEAFGEQLTPKPLIAAGLIVPSGQVAAIVCTECQVPHITLVELYNGQIW